MKDFTRTDLLFSLCGLNCGLCPMQTGGHCPGCGGGEGNQPCSIACCSLQHGKPEYCSLCEKFPCERYEGVEEFDSFITHQNQIGDLQKRDKIGTENYRKEQKEKRAVLDWLLHGYNDGRKRSFFCLAANLLDLTELEEIKSQISQKEELGGLPLKEKAAYVKRLLEDKAGQRGMVLKLRKKR